MISSQLLIYRKDTLIFSDNACYIVPSKLPDNIVSLFMYVYRSNFVYNGYQINRKRPANTCNYKSYAYQKRYRNMYQYKK